MAKFLIKLLTKYYFSKCLHILIDAYLSIVLIYIQGSPNAVHKLGGKVENTLRNHKYIGKHGWKRNPN